MHKPCLRTMLGLSPTPSYYTHILLKLHTSHAGVTLLRMSSPPFRYTRPVNSTYSAYQLRRRDLVERELLQ